MKKKSKGFTLIEVIITLALTVIVLGVIYGIFNTNNKSLIATDIKSTLQSDAENIQMNISKIGMQSRCISGALKDDEASTDIINTNYDSNGFLSTDEENKKCIYISEISFTVPNDDGNDEFYTVKIDKATKELILESTSVGERILSRNTNNLKIIPNNINDTSSNLTKAKAVTFEIELEKKQGYSDIKYPVSITVNFRNAD